jgi:hypothetical protein
MFQQGVYIPVCFILQKKKCKLISLETSTTLVRYTRRLFCAMALQTEVRQKGTERWASHCGLAFRTATSISRDPGSSVHSNEYVRPRTYYSKFITYSQLHSWIKIDQLDVTCFFISLFNAQHVSDVNTSILRSLRLIYWVISWVVLLWYDVCWCYVVVWLGWCGIRMQVEALVLHWQKCGVSLWAGPSYPGHSGRCWRCHIDFAESGASTAKVIVLNLLFFPRLLTNVWSHSSVSSTFVAMLSCNPNVLILSCVGKGYHKKEWTNRRTNRPTDRQVEGLAFNMAVRQGILITEIYYSVSYLKLCHYFSKPVQPSTHLFTWVFQATLLTNLMF